MQNQGVKAYANTAKLAINMRDLEADLLIKAAQMLQSVQDNWDNKHKTELNDALNYNRKLWVIFLQAVTQDDNPLPNHIKQNIANLGIYVINTTMEMISRPVPEKLTSMVSINRTLAAGLRQKPVDQAATQDRQTTKPTGDAA